MPWPDHPQAPPAGTRLCALVHVPDGAGRGFAFGPGEERFRLLVVRRGDRVWGFVNACRHFGVPLDRVPGYRFVDSVTGDIRCQVHGARYAADTGACTWGECKGLGGLEPVPLRVDDGMVVIG